MNAYMHQKMYTSILIALFVIAKNWKQTHCPSLGEWINYSLYKPQNTAQWKNEQTTEVHDNMDESHSTVE